MKPPPHEDDSYGGCVSCRVLLDLGPAFDDLVTYTVPFPCPTVQVERLAAALRKDHWASHASDASKDHDCTYWGCWCVGCDGRWDCCEVRALLAQVSP